MPETRTVKGFAEVGLPLAEGDFECCTFDHSDNSPLSFGKSFCRFVTDKFYQKQLLLSSDFTNFIKISLFFCPHLQVG